MYQVYTIMIQYLYTLQCNHHTHSSNHLSPCQFFTIIDSIPVHHLPCVATSHPAPSLAIISLISASESILFCYFVFLDSTYKYAVFGFL